MQKRFSVEETTISSNLLFIDESKKEDKYVLEILISHFAQSLKVYALSQKKTSFSGVKHISTLSTHFLDKLGGDVPYTVLFLTDEKRKRSAVEEISKLSQKNTKILLLLKRGTVGKFIDVILQVRPQENVQVVLLGEIFSEKHLDLPFSKNIEIWLANRSIDIPENGLEEVQCVSLDHAIRGIDYALFSDSTVQEFIAVYYATPGTNVSLAHSLKRVEHDFSVRYVKKKSQNNSHVVSERDLKKRIGAQRDISFTFQGFEKSIKEFSENQATSYKPRKQKHTRSTLKHFLQAFKANSLLIISAFVLYILASMICVSLSMFFFKTAVADIGEGKIKQSLQHIKTAQVLYEFGKTPIKLIVLQGNIIYPNPTIKYLESYESALSIVGAAEKEVQKTLSQNDFLDQAEVDSIISSAFFLYFLTHDVGIVNFENKSFDKYLPLVPVIKEALGYGKTMRYLLLFQNNNELRPTGGFIGSVGYVEVKNGKVEQMEIQDVYDLDGQLREHVEPHFVIRRYLQPHLYLRDSNFHPDFEMSASSAAYLFNKESGNKTDGVIALDTSVLKKVVEIAGPVQIPGQKAPFTKDNIDVFIHEAIHDDFFPGSREKKDLLNRVFNVLLSTLEQDTQKQLRLLKELPSLFSEKHVLVSFQDQSLQKGIIAAGIGGSLVENRIEGDILDTVSINEANIGVNKINSFIKRDIEYSVFLNPQEYTVDILAQYENNGEEDYVMYFRALVPKNARLESITIDSVVQNIVPFVVDSAFYERQGFSAPAGLEVAEEDISEDIKSIGFRAVVPSGSQKRISLITKTGIPAQLSATFSYSLRYIKQPGTGSYPLTVTFQSSNEFKRVKNGSPVIYNGKADNDKEFQVELQKLPEVNR